MPPRRTTRQSATSTTEAEAAPAPARRTRASLSQAPAAPADDSIDELEMEEPVKPVKKPRGPSKKVEKAAKEEKPAGRKAPVRKSAKSTTVEPAVKPKAAGRRKVKEVAPIVESEQEDEEDAEGSVATVEEEDTVKPFAEESAAAPQQPLAPPTANGDPSGDEEDEEPTIRRAPSSAPRHPSSQPQPSSRRPSIPIPVPAQTEDDALDALLSQSQHRSIHNQRTANPIPQTPMPGRTVPQTPAPATARTRFVPGTVQGTSMKGRAGLFPQTPGGMGRTPGPSQGQDQALDVKPAAAPKKRLVIHKLVLVDFKSYAGRQEIGPFHKVCTQSESLLMARGRLMFHCSTVLQRNRRPQRFREIQHHRRAPFRLRLPSKQDETRKAFRADPSFGRT